MLPPKIKNLKKIKKNKLNVPKFLYFTDEDYKKNKFKILNKIKKEFKDKIILRSSSFNEDVKKSNAGKFLSIENLSKDNLEKIDISIKKIFSSYGKSLNRYIIVQHYISNAVYSGVIFTRDINNYAPFTTINFKRGKKTNIITSGSDNGSIITIYNNYKINNKKFPKEIKKFTNKIKKIYNNSLLDIEFVLTKKKLYIVQVRELNFKGKKEKINFQKYLNILNKKLSKLIYEKTDIAGDKSYFSTMTDWNPAEIIGLKPKPLAQSLYENLITNSVWAESRAKLGYKNLNNHALMSTFYGTPYVNLKNDFNSFLYDEMNKKDQVKLVNYYLNKFKVKPYFFFDKVESKLVINCITFDYKKKIKFLKDCGFKKKKIDEIIRKYSEITSNIIFDLNKNILKYERSYDKLRFLKKSKIHPINKIYQYTNLCKYYGTLPFANLARMSFVGMEFLNSMKDEKIITENEKEYFLNSISNISTEIRSTLVSKSKNEFIKKYGHLRPNTYEISNLNYRQNYNQYFNQIDKNEKFIKKKFKFSNEQLKLIQKKLDEIKINISSNDLINFIKKSIYHRERSKLYFSKFIDEIFEELRKLFKKLKISEKYISYTDLNLILSIYNNFNHHYLKKTISEDNYKNYKNYNFNLKFNLPNVITNQDDIYYNVEKFALPKFIGNKSVNARIKFLNNFNKTQNLRNRIILIENADPGFDFIFSNKIKGLITAFGGPNSHMAIRCSEFGLPAVIGVGKKKFENLKSSNSILLDCNRKVIIKQ